jgi:hypothetical protein
MDSIQGGAGRGGNPCLHLSKPTEMGLEMTENEDIRSEGIDL